MHISLINLPSPWAKTPAMNPPLGLCYLSTALKLNTAYHITGVDLDLGDPIKPAMMYGIYCMTPQYESLVNIIREIRDIISGALIVVGGPHPTSCPRDCLNAGADIAVRGPGELAILDIVENGKREPIIEGTLPPTLNHIPFPDRDLFRLDRYHRTLNQEQAIHIITLRGCPFQCAFCDKQSVGKTLHLRSVIARRKRCPGTFGGSDYANNQTESVTDYLNHSVGDFLGFRCRQGHLRGRRCHGCK